MLFAYLEVKRWGVCPTGPPHFCDNLALAYALLHGNQVLGIVRVNRLKTVQVRDIFVRYCPSILISL